MNKMLKISSEISFDKDLIENLVTLDKDLSEIRKSLWSRFDRKIVNHFSKDLIGKL